MGIKMRKKLRMMLHDNVNRNNCWHEISISKQIILSVLCNRGNKQFFLSSSQSLQLGQGNGEVFYVCYSLIKHCSTERFLRQMYWSEESFVIFNFFFPFASIFTAHCPIMCKNLRCSSNYLKNSTFVKKAFSLMCFDFYVFHLFTFIMSICVN